MLTQEPTPIIEGLAEDLTPVAYATMQSTQAAVGEWNRDGGDIQSLVDVLLDSNKATIKALARIEMDVRTLKGEVEQR